MKRSKLIKLMSLTLAVVVAGGSVVLSYDKKTSKANESEINNEVVAVDESENSLDLESNVETIDNGLEILQNGTPADAESNQYKEIVTRASQTQDLNINGARLTSNTWRDTSATKSGNTYQWKYQVSAKYNGGAAVERIRTTWKISAVLRSSATLNIGVSSAKVVTASASATYKTYTSEEKYWENTKGQKEASYRSNFVITPCSNYKTGSRSVVNTAMVKLRGDAREFRISSGV